jgi:hypothetical protein
MSLFDVFSIPDETLLTNIRILSNIGMYMTCSEHF